MIRACLPLALLLACSSSSSPTSSGSTVPMRATSGPVSQPKPVLAPTDRDHDGVPDANDACPTQAGGPRDGCPVVDRDGDGISDKYDKCPDVAEVRNHKADGDGCPN